MNATPRCDTPTLECGVSQCMLPHQRKGHCGAPWNRPDQGMQEKCSKSFHGNLHKCTLEERHHCPRLIASATCQAPGVGDSCCILSESLPICKSPIRVCTQMWSKCSSSFGVHPFLSSPDRAKGLCSRMSNQPLQDQHLDGLRHQLELLQYQVVLESIRLGEASGALDHNLAAASPTKNKTLFTKGAGGGDTKTTLAHLDCWSGHTNSNLDCWSLDCWSFGVAHLDCWSLDCWNVLHKCKRRWWSNPRHRLSHQIP